jgi:hypothetical protein
MKKCTEEERRERLLTKLRVAQEEHTKLCIDQKSICNLLQLVSKDVISNASVSVYLACALYANDSITVAKIQKKVQLSATIVRHHLKIFETLGIMKITRHQGIPLKILVRPITNSLLSNIFNDKVIIANTKEYIDININKYNTSSRTINKYIEEGDPSVQVQELMKHLPEKFSNFKVTKHNLRQLELLAADLRLQGAEFETYVKWFVHNKLGKSVHSFGMGIFLYPGLIEEFKNRRLRTEKAENYKHVRSRKSKFDRASVIFEEELNDQL